MSARIRVSTSGIPIEVNDNGDTIELRTDAEFMKECLNIQRNFRDSAEKYEALLNDENSAPEAVAEAIDEVFKTTDEAIDRLFGAGSCAKIFPPRRGVMQYTEFFTQLSQIMSEQQSAAADKYLANREQRRGARKK